MWARVGSHPSAGEGSLVVSRDVGVPGMLAMPRVHPMLCNSVSD